jgi:hypothetical protein
MKSVVKMVDDFVSHRLPGWLAAPSRFDGRMILAAVLFLYLTIIGLAEWQGAPAETWRVLGVASLKPSFADARVITLGWDNYRRGFNPLRANPSDPWQRLMNYPRLWLLPSYLGLGERHTVVLGCLAAAAFFCLAFVLMGRLTSAEAAVCALLLFSPATMLAVERGNCDLVIFAMLACVLLFLQKRRVIAYGLLLLAAFLKLYPIFALLAAVREKKRAALAVLGCLGAVFFAYVVLTLPDIIQISKIVDRPTLGGYGCLTFADKVTGSLQFRGYDPGSWPRVLATAVAVIVMVAAVRAGLKLRQPGVRQSSILDGFRIGSLLYAGTFLIGNNYDYRLILLLLAVPQLLAWIKSSQELRMMASASVLCILAAMWENWLLLNAWWSRFLVMAAGEFIHWMLFALLLMLFSAMLPDWLPGIPRVVVSNPDGRRDPEANTGS